MLRYLTLTLLALAVGAPPARPDGSDKMLPDVGAIHAMLLRQKSVREGLKLSEEETRKIEAHNDRQWKRAQEIHKLPEAERHEKYAVLAHENEQFLDRALEPAQRKRLDQISIQFAGLLMVTKPALAAELNLSSEQIEHLKRHQHTARRELGEALSAKSPRVREEKLKELGESSRTRLFEVLNDQQEAKLKELAGPPFEGKFLYDPLD